MVDCKINVVAVEKPVVWCALGVHPVLQHHVIRSQLSAFLNGPNWQHVYRCAGYGDIPCIRIAWKNVTSFSVHKIQRINLVQ